MPAQVSEAGPEPMQATRPFAWLSLVSTGQDSGAAAQAARWVSATKRSRRPMAMASPLAFRMHLPSHWCSCGHTRPHTAGRLLAVRIIS